MLGCLRAILAVQFYFPSWKQMLFLMRNCRNSALWSSERLLNQTVFDYFLYIIIINGHLITKVAFRGSFESIFHALENSRVLSLLLLERFVFGGDRLLLLGELLENFALTFGQFCGNLYSQGYYLIASAFHALYTLFQMTVTSPLMEIVLPSCEPYGILISFLPQMVSTCLRIPRAAWEMVIHSVESMSNSDFLNFGCLLTTNFSNKSPLGPFQL